MRSFHPIFQGFMIARLGRWGPADYGACLDMLRVYAEEYVQIGRYIQNAILTIGIIDLQKSELTHEEEEEIRVTFDKLLHQCKKINLSVSTCFAGKARKLHTTYTQRVGDDG